MLPGLSLPGVLLTFRGRVKLREAAGAVVGHSINGCSILIAHTKLRSMLSLREKSPA